MSSAFETTHVPAVHQMTEVDERAYEVFLVYCAVKAHFQGQFDFFKYKGKMNIPREAFLARNDKPFFYFVSSRFKARADVLKFFIANVVFNTRFWIGDDNKLAMDEYDKWQGRIIRLHNVIEEDLNDLAALMRKRRVSGDRLIKAEEGSHPALMRMYLGKLIQPETFMLIAVHSGAFPLWETVLGKDTIYKQEVRKMSYYSAFFDLDTLLAKFGDQISSLIQYTNVSE